MDFAAYNRYREAASVLQRGRERLVEELTEELLDRGEDLLDCNFQLAEFLENQGTKLHFLTMLLAQLEQSADVLDDRRLAEAERRAAQEQLQKAAEKAVKAAEKAATRKPAKAKAPRKVTGGQTRRSAQGKREDG